MVLNYKKFLEKNTYHSMNDLYNLARQIKDFTYNNDVQPTDYFKSIVETNNGFVVDFSFNGDKVYKIKKDKVENHDIEISIDEAFYNLDMLFNMIQTYLYSFNIQQIDESNGSFNKEIFIEFYQQLCKDEKINPIPIKFKLVGRGGGCLVYDVGTKIPSHIEFDINKVHDIEFALYHEFAHQICLIKYKDPGHGNKFKKEFNRINDKYMYGDLATNYMKKILK